jgi:hypothetical protein
MWQTDYLNTREAVLAQVDIRNNITGEVYASSFVCVMRLDGSLCDPETGDDIGWAWDDLDRWILLSDVIRLVEAER